MRGRILSEDQMLNLEGKIPQDMVVVYLKYIAVGPQTQELPKSELMETIGKQGGFFLITPMEELESTLNFLSKEFTDKIK